jgi:hypothetical protein
MNELKGKRRRKEKGKETYKKKKKVTSNAKIIPKITKKRKLN